MKFSKRITSMFGAPKKRRTPQSEIPFRLNFLMWAVGVLLCILVARLFYMQVLNGDTYKAEVNRSESSTETGNVQRGAIYDSTGQVLVGNQSHQAITYTKSESDTSIQIYKTAKELSKYVTVSTTKLTERNKIDFLLADTKTYKSVTNKIAGSSKLSDDALYNKALKYVENHKSEYSLTKTQKNAAMIFADMSGAYSLSTIYIKETGVTSKEIAEVGEHLSEMSGVKVGTSWTRNYPQGDAIQSLTGTVSTQKSGLPSDKINTLLSQGYSRNDSVGQSYLESSYQSTLAGSKSQTEVSTSGSITKAVQKYAGKKGDNLVLTINAKFQNEVQNIVKTVYKTGSISASTGAYAVVMNPNTGAIYAMAGVDRNVKTGEITDDQIGSINHPITMGSVVKGATILGAEMDGVISPSNNTLLDQPIELQGTAAKTSWFNKTGSANISLSASDALEVSSNSYMMQLAMKEGGFTYSSGAGLDMPTSIFSKLRGYFNEFGLGVKTGIDLPGESTGYTGVASQAEIGKALDLSYGNYDSYTVMQIAQYASTIANGGYRMKPYIVQQVRGTNSDGSLGKVESTTQPTILGSINATAAQWKLVTQGMYQVVHGTSAYKTGGALASLSPSVAAKSGTAETFYGTASTQTLSLISYAPYDDPQVVVAIAVPGLGTTGAAVNTTMASQIYEAYWKDVQSSDGYK